MNAPTAAPLNRLDLAHRYREVRAQTERLCTPLATDDYQVQSALETSPPKWHLAHVSWFFETFLLKPESARYRLFHPVFEQIFNSYYETVGSYHPRARRGVLSRPTVEEVYRYRRHVDEAMLGLIDTIPDTRWSALAARVTLGLHHEQQHQELLLMDIKHNFAANPLRPAYQPGTSASVTSAAPLRWIECPGGIVEIGHAGNGFAFDNETPRHAVLLHDHALASRLTTNGEYLDFMTAGGYDDVRLWLADGWAKRHEHAWHAPLYWEVRDGQWWQMTLGGMRPLKLDEPVCHVSFYEADAYARWAGRRLPREEELETMLVTQPVDGNCVESGLLQPRAAADGDGQWYGDVWEWTRSSYAPYPGFVPLAGSLGEYNGKFMANQMVLRGGSCVTPQSHLRESYRNFFYPHDRWPFAGIRLAADR
ncbi:MAG: ergothioneine biosynthesis protein EgtB [Burkholderiales bacterium]